MSTYSLINNGDSGLSVRTTLNELLQDANDGVFVGPAGSAGVSGSSGSSGSSGTNGSSGTSGSFDSGATYSNLVNVATYSNGDNLQIWSGNTAPESGSAIDLNVPNQGRVILKGNSLIRVEATGNVWLGDSSSFNGSYAVLLGRGVSNNGTDGNVLIGFGAAAGGGGLRDSFAVGQSNLNGANIGHRYQDFTAAMGFGLIAKMRDAINTHKLHLSRIPGQFIWSTSSNSYVAHSGFSNDDDFYTNYIGRDATTPSGATAGSLYAQPGGNVVIAGSGGYNYLDPALDFADDTAAATGGVAIGQLYHNSGAVRVRLT